MTCLLSSRIIIALISLFFLSGCATEVEIKYVETTRIEGIGDRFQVLKTQENIFPIEGSGFYMIKLQSNKNIRTIIDEKEMAFLYYELFLCNDNGKLPSVYSAPVLIDKSTVSDNADVYYFYAPIPLNYMEEINRQSFMQGKNSVDVMECFYLGLGAGNMMGNILKTNIVKIKIQ